MSNPELSDSTAREDTIDLESSPSNINEKPSPPSTFTIPDGGWRSWTVVLGSALVLFSTFGYVSYTHPHLHYISLITKHR